MSQAKFVERLEAGDLPGALEAFAALEDRARATDILCDVSHELEVNDWDQLQLGMALCDAVLPEAPARSDVHLWRLDGLCRLGRFEEAFDFAREHVGRPDVRWRLYEMLCVHGKLDEADALLPRLADDGDDGPGEDYYDLGCKLHRTRPATALALYRGAIACDGPAPQCHINAGIAALAIGSATECIALARAGLEHAPRDPNLWANLLDASTRVGDAAVIAEARGIVGTSSRCDECEHVAQPSACAIGCGALLDDLMKALIASGDAAGAASLYLAHDAGDAERNPRAVVTYALALALSGDGERADQLLDGGLSAELAREPAFYRARAAAAWARGDRDRAAGALAAALGDDHACIDAVRRDPAFAAIADHPDLAAGRRLRPPGVPADAVWDPDDWGEWVHATRDDAGRRQGQVRYFRADGSVCCECPHVDDAAHGSSTRYHEDGAVSQTAHFVAGALHGTRVWHPSARTTTELTLAPGMSRDIVRVESDYEDDVIVATRNYLAGDRLCAADGTPYPDWPASVPAGGFYDGKAEVWRHGALDGGLASGVWRTWSPSGVLTEEQSFEAGVPHGPFRAYFADGAESVTGQFDRDDKVGVWVYHRRGDDAHEDFPTAGTRVVEARVDFTGGGSAATYIDSQGRHTVVDGTPLSEMPSLHPELGSWFDDLAAVDWGALEDAGGAAHDIPRILVGLLAEDEGDSEEISDGIFGELYWHLCNKGTVYSATAAALPLVIRLAMHPRTPYRPPLVMFISRSACTSPENLAEARENEWHDVLGCYQALIDHLEPLSGLLSSDDAELRAVATNAISGAHARADEATRALLEAHEREADPVVRGSMAFALGRLGTDAGLDALTEQLALDGLAGDCAAMALVMARGAGVSPAVIARLIVAVENAAANAEAYATMPWADDHLLAELAQALAVAGDGAPILARLTARFDDGDGDGALAIVHVAIAIALQLGEGQLTDELRHVLGALVRAKAPWRHDALPEVLSGFGLPQARDQLATILA